MLLGYQFDRPFLLQTVGQLKRDSTFMSARIARTDEGRSDDDSDGGVGLNIDDVVGLHVDDTLIQNEQNKLRRKLNDGLGKTSNLDDDASASSIASSFGPSGGGVGGGVNLSRSLKLRSVKQRKGGGAADDVKHVVSAVDTARSNVSGLTLSTSSSAGVPKRSIKELKQAHNAVSTSSVQRTFQKSAKGK